MCFFSSNQFIKLEIIVCSKPKQDGNVVWQSANYDKVELMIDFVLMILCLQYFGEDASLSKILKQLKSETFQKEIGGALFKRKGRCWRWNSMLIFRVNKSQSCNLWSLLNVHMFFASLFTSFFPLAPFTGITWSEFISGERLLCQNISYSFLCLQSCQFRWDRSTGGDCQF